MNKALQLCIKKEKDKKEKDLESAGQWQDGYLDSANCHYGLGLGRCFDPHRHRRHHHLQPICG